MRRSASRCQPPDSTRRTSPSAKGESHTTLRKVASNRLLSSAFARKATVFEKLFRGPRSADRGRFAQQLIGLDHAAELRLMPPVAAVAIGVEAADQLGIAATQLGAVDVGAE